MKRPQEYYIKPKGTDLAAMFRNWLKKQPIAWIRESESVAVIKKFKRQLKLSETLDTLKIACVYLIKQYTQKHDEGLQKKKDMYANKHRFF